MPIRGEEIRVTEDDVTATARPSDNGRAAGQRSMDALRAAFMQKIFSFIQSASVEELAQIRQAIDRRDPPGRANMLDRALLSLYLNLTPFILSLVFIAPLVVWLGWVYQEIRPLLVGRAPSCPPACTWWDIAYWAGVGGVSLITAVLVSYWLRGRLMQATKKG